MSWYGEGVVRWPDQENITMTIQAASQLVVLFADRPELAGWVDELKVRIDDAWRQRNAMLN